jgi:hypothetical protein
VLTLKFIAETLATRIKRITTKGELASIKSDLNLER